jgi:hypothetical protein
MKSTHKYNAQNVIGIMLVLSLLFMYMYTSNSNKVVFSKWMLSAQSLCDRNKIFKSELKNRTEQSRAAADVDSPLHYSM